MESSEDSRWSTTWDTASRWDRSCGQGHIIGSRVSSVRAEGSYPLSKEINYSVSAVGRTRDGLSRKFLSKFKVYIILLLVLFPSPKHLLIVEE